MKNIHLLPTQKPSRLFKDGEKLKLDIESYGVNNQHIYITSDEKPENNDWCYDKSVEGRIVRFTALPKHWRDTQKKIILTTDPDLISDGVQAIGDDFLEWFVKNPSCEFVKVVSELKAFDKNGFCISYAIYDTDYTKMMYYIIPEEESKQEFPLFDKEKTDVITNEGQKVVRKLQNIIQEETIEDAAERNCESITHPYCDREKSMFIKGAKWMAKRMFSEEDLKLFARQYYREIKLDKSNLLWDDLADKCLEQFKKK
jgi:hypothetical protein